MKLNYKSFIHTKNQKMEKFLNITQHRLHHHIGV